MILLRRSQVERVSKNVPGLLEAVLAVASKDLGTHIEISRTEFDRIQKEQFGKFRLGTILHFILKPIAHAAGLTNCGGCAERELELNAASRPINR